MIELLQAQQQLAAAMMRVAESDAERTAWRQFHRQVTAQLEQLQRPPPPRERPEDDEMNRTRT